MNFNYFVSYALAVLCCAGLATSCGKNETEDISLNYGLAYFPTDSSHYITYRVDSVLYSSFATGGRDTTTWEVKEQWNESFTDLQGKTARTLLRYQRPWGSTQLWSNIVPTVWYAVHDSTRAERMEGEMRWIKLVFPLQNNSTWNATSYINTDNANLSSFANWQFAYTAIDQAATIGGQTFPQTLTVERTNNDENLVEKKLYKETYAKDIGSIYRQEWVLNLGDKDIASGLPWPERAGLGYITVSQMIDYCNTNCD